MQYVYRNEETGDLVSLELTITEKEAREKFGEIILDNGDLGKRDFSAEHGGFKDVCATEIRSDSLGCDPSQCDEYERDAVSRGVPTSFDRRTGQAIFADRNHRNRYMRSLRNPETGERIIDKDGGYGDPT